VDVSDCHVDYPDLTSEKIVIFAESMARACSKTEGVSLPADELFATKDAVAVATRLASLVASAGHAV
jgi:hypothetical protein